MADSFNVSYGFTASTTTVNLPRPALNYADDFTVKTDSSNSKRTSECVLTNITSPLDQPEILRYSIEDINDIYSGTTINPSFMSQSKKGFSLLVQLNEVVRVTDSANPSFTLDLPVSVHAVIKAPKNRFITAAMLQSLHCRLLGAFFTTEDTTNSPDMLARMIRGSLNPLQ